MQMATVRLIVNLFDDINFSGPFRTLVSDLNDFRLIEFNDRTSSVQVIQGPNFQPGDAARLFDNINFGGASITLPPGNYPDLRQFNFNDLASSLRIVGTTPPPDSVIAEDFQRETLQFNLRVIPPAGATLVSVNQNRILNPTCSGSFVGDTGVIINGSFIDELIVTINQGGINRQATGQATITFSKQLNFPQIAGLNKNNLRINCTISNVSQNFTVSGNVVTKTVQFDLRTQVIRLLTGSGVETAEVLADELGPQINEHIVEVE